MSWDSYIENLTKTGGVTKAAICGFDGSTWAISEGWSVSPDEVRAIVAGFSNPSNFTEKGILVATEKFFFLSQDGETVRGKKGQNGIHISKTNQAVIIAYYMDPIMPGQCAKEVETVADYLKSNNY